MWNNNRVTPFRYGFSTTKGIPVCKICLNDGLDFVYLIHILVLIDVKMDTHYNDVGARISVSLKSFTLTIIFL